jgi:membrane-associated phospholipid phosphatase
LAIHVGGVIITSDVTLRASQDQSHEAWKFPIAASKTVDPPALECASHACAGAAAWLPHSIRINISALRYTARKEIMRKYMMHGRSGSLLGLTISTFALVGFILLASVFQQEWFLQRDLAFTQRIHANEESRLSPVLDIVTDMGKSVLIVIVLEVAALLWIRRRWADLAFWSITIAAGFVLNLVLRVILQGPRPYLEDMAIIQQNTGFPSGHAMMSLITYGLLAYGLRGILSRRNWLLVTSALILLVLLIGYSRMHFGVHYLSDVIGGYVAGLGWLSLCLSIRGMLPAVVRTQRVGASGG